MVGNSQSEFIVKIHTFIPRNLFLGIPRKILGIPWNSKSHFAREMQGAYKMCTVMNTVIPVCD